MERGGVPHRQQDDLADREVTIMGDKGTPFSVLKRVMATATAAMLRAKSTCRVVRLPAVFSASC